MLEIRNTIFLQFLIYLCRDTTPIYRDLYLEISKNLNFIFLKILFIFIFDTIKMLWTKYTFPFLSIVHLHVQRTR